MLVSVAIFFFFDSDFPSPCFDVPKASNFTSGGVQNCDTKNRRLGTTVTSIQDSKPREKQISQSGFLGFRIRRLHKLYSLSGIYFYVSLVTNILFELCNHTPTALDTQAHSSSCTPIPVFES